jgi:hypothetical protein
LLLISSKKVLLTLPGADKLSKLSQKDKSHLLDAFHHLKLSHSTSGQVSFEKGRKIRHRQVAAGFKTFSNLSI